MPERGRPFASGALCLFAALTLALAAGTFGLGPGGAHADEWSRGFIQPRGGVGAMTRRLVGVAVVHLRGAQLGQAARGVRVLGPRVAVAEVVEEVEPQPLRQPPRLRHRLGVLREARGHRLRRGEEVAVVAAAQGLQLACRHDAPAIVQGNRQLLAQLLTNLIENGLKYVPAGGRIEVAVRRLSDCVQLTVSDNGPGIAAQDRVRALQPFVRFGPTARQEGSGLGLSLVAAIARLHRGRLELQSNDPGLKVVIELPA